VYHITTIVPAFLLSRSVDDVKPALELYADFIASQNVVLAEMELWKQKWVSVSASTIPTVIPSTPIDALNCCQEAIFPNVYVLLTIACILPVTTASAERSFSSLRRLKTYLRSTMCTERLNGLSIRFTFITTWTSNLMRSLMISQKLLVDKRLKSNKTKQNTKYRLTLFHL